MDFLERDEHVRRLSQALELASRGQGRIAAISGEAGAGKTTLVERFTAGLGSRAKVHWGACEHLSTPEPLLPLRDILRSSGRRLEPNADHLTSFETLLDLLSGDEPASVMVLEDVHWADAATLDLIRFLGRRIGRLRVLVLITYRSEEASAHSPLRHVLGDAPAGSVERIGLEPLSLGAVSRLAERVGRKGEELYALTGGNAFLVTEALAVEGDAPPDTVRDATLARAAGLPEQGRTVLATVSIFPRRAPAALVAELTGEAFQPGVDACAEKGMLVLDGAAVRFRHELARRSIESSVAPARRADLHQKVVDALRSDPNARAAEIAHHAERAGDVTTLIEFAQRAGTEAAKATAFREAAAHYATVLRHRDALDPASVVDLLERHATQAYLAGAAETARVSMLEAVGLRREAGDPVKLGRVLTQLTRIAWMCGRRAEAEGYIEEAVRVLGAAPPGPELAWAYSHKSQLDMLAYKLGDAIEWGTKAIALAEKLGEEEAVIHALGNVGAAALEPEGPADERLEESFDLAKRNGFHDHVERASCNMTCTAYWRRDYRSALHFIQRGVAYAAERDLIHWEAYLRGWRAMIRLDQGDWAGAEKEAEMVAGWTAAPTVFRSPALFALARLRVRRGDPDAGTPLEAVRRVADSLNELQRSIFIAVIDAECAWASNPFAADEKEDGANRTDNNRVAAALAALHAAHDEADELGVRWVADASALWLHHLGEPVAATAKLSQPYRDHCEGRWREAAGGWRALGFPYEEALALSQGDDEAQRQALAIFDRLGAAPAAARMRRVMRARGAKAIPRGPIAGTRASPAGLTRRQVQVLSLVDEGLSNPEIADRLCISAKTAEHHVSALMARLEAATRREAAAEARKRGLIGG